MEFLADLIARQLASLASPGLLVAVVVTTVVLASGLAARIIEICEAVRLTRYNRAEATPIR